MCIFFPSYDNVENANCRSYFTVAGQADFDTLSSTLNDRKAAMLENAITCLVSDTASEKH